MADGKALAKKCKTFLNPADDGHARCECGRVIPDDGVGQYIYCPWCGGELIWWYMENEEAD